MTDAEIEDRLLKIDVGGRFDGDIEFLNRVRHDSYTEENYRRIRDLLRNSGIKLESTLRDD